MLMCPYCGWNYDPRDYDLSILPGELVPHHSFPPLTRAVCQGAKQHPRNPETDRRPLWKDLGTFDWQEGD